MNYIHLLPKKLNHFKASLFATFAVVILSLGIMNGVVNFGLFKKQQSIVATKEVQTLSDPTLMTGQDWKYYPGAVVESNNVTFNPLVRKIVNQDGSGGQVDPAVNVSRYLSFNSDFQLDFNFDQANNGQSQSVRLYAALPVIYDEWRQETASLNIEIHEESLFVDIYDGNSQEPTGSEYKIKTNGSYNLVLKTNGNKLFIILNDKEVTNIDAQKLLASKKLWFGVGAEASWKLKPIVVGSADNKAQFNDTLPVSANSIDATLAKLMTSKAGKKFGTAVSLYPLIADYEYQKLAITQFSQWTTENELKSQFVHPEKDQYQFGPADLLVKIAQDNNISVHGHALVFGEANPAWMQQLPKVQLEDVMTDHVNTIVSHFSNSIQEWDVINEPLSDNDADFANGGNGLRRHIWYNAMGEQYIAKALLSARKANPYAKLYINDYGLEEDGQRWEAMLSLIRKLQKQDIPLDGIGFQSHIYEEEDHESTDVIVRHMKQLKDMGLETRISEIDVHGENAKVQSQQYQNVLKACLQSENCTSFTTWGITDKYGSTTNDHTYPAEYGNDLLWDDKYQPKIAQKDLNKLLSN